MSKPTTLLFYLAIGIIILHCHSVFGTQNKALSIQLNHVLDSVPIYDQAKGNKINQLMLLKKISNLSPEQQYEANAKLVAEYTKYKMDSAIHYLRQNINLAEQLHWHEPTLKDKLTLSLLYSATGQYIEAKALLDQAAKHSMPSTLLPVYYDAQNKFYEHYAQSNAHYSYYQLAAAYRDSLLAVLDPSSIKYRLAFGEKISYDKCFDTAEAYLLALIDTLPNHSPSYAIATYLLGRLYSEMGDQTLCKKYYTLSIICDLQNSTKDHASLQSLALVLYKEGHVNQAYRLMKQTIEDAMFCNVRFRTIEASEFYSVINTSYLYQEARQKSTLLISLVIISVLVICLILAIVYVYRQMKRVSGVRKRLYNANMKLTNLNMEIVKTNERLSEANLSLAEANHIKEEYIAHFFDLCSAYINKLEDYRKSLNKKATTKQLDELFVMLKSRTFVENELDELYKNFDHIFLGLYPTFIEDFNSLLIPEEQVRPKSNELLNTELRIFALIRLGITDSVKIAAFLRYSLSTIYNYRTKARNKAVVLRDEFESKVMKIGLIQRK